MQQQHTLHVLLGAGGAIATELSKLITADGHPVRLVSRRPVTTDHSLITWQQADLLRADQTLAATRGATVIYLCAGLRYDTKVWQEQWPVIMRNVITATEATGARLIFFDNIYAYGLVDGPITEATPYRPSSAKGEVRARIAGELLQAVAAGRLRASIARAPDFYGIYGDNSFLDSMVINKLKQGDRALWVGNPARLHNFIYVPDAARATYTLAQHPHSDNQVWHLPTPPPISGKDLLALVAATFRVPERHFTINKAMLRLLGLFDPVVKNSVEMYYQYDRDYHFDSTKFERTFGVQPTPYREALEEISQR